MEISKWKTNSSCSGHTYWVHGSFNHWNQEEMSPTDRRGCFSQGLQGRSLPVFTGWKLAGKSPCSIGFLHLLSNGQFSDAIWILGSVTNQGLKGFLITTRMTAWILFWGLPGNPELNPWCSTHIQRPSLAGLMAISTHLWHPGAMPWSFCNPGILGGVNRSKWYCWWNKILQHFGTSVLYDCISSFTCEYVYMVFDTSELVCNLWIMGYPTNVGVNS